MINAVIIWISLCSAHLHITLLVCCVTILADAGVENRCPSHITNNLYLQTHAGKCYHFVFTEKKWYDANHHCVQQGGTLITIKSLDVQEFVARVLTNVTRIGSRLWIGATDDHHEQDWRWVTGVNVSSGYSNWQKGSPSCIVPTYLCREDCACLLLDKGYTWYDTFCSANDYKYGFICEYDMQNGTLSMSGRTARLKQHLDPVAVSGTEEETPVVPPLGENLPQDSTEQRLPFSSLATGAGDVDRCPTNIARNLYLRTHESKCYQFIFEEKKWFDAKHHCDTQGGTLLTIERPDIQAFVKQTLINVTWGGSRLWIGATDDHLEHDWKWVTGQNVSAGYSNWKEGSPSCYLPVYLCREDCACLLLEEGCVWYTTFCSANDFQYGFICQFDMSLEATTRTSTLSPTVTSTPSTASSKKHSTQRTTTTAAEKMYNSSFNAVPTTNTYVSRAPDITEVHGEELTTWAIIGIIFGVICLLLAIIHVGVSIAVLCNQLKCTQLHERNDVKARIRYSKTAVPRDDVHVFSDLLDKDGRSRTGIQEASSDAESFKSVGSRTSSDSQKSSNQFVTPQHGNDPCESVHIDDKCSLDQPLRRPAQENQTSIQPNDPADQTAAEFNSIYNTQRDMFIW